MTTLIAQTVGAALNAATIGSATMSQPAAVDPKLAFIFRRPFAEQVAFFRGKLGNLVPTARWDDILKSAHDRAFMVAGAAKADLLADLADAVNKAINEGETLDAFRKRFFAAVEKGDWHGWTGEATAAGRAWRTRIIYQTNLATSYAAGRLAQLNDGQFRYWIYRHTPCEHPRLHHLAWDGMTLPADHPFWQTHYPPNGFGCRCYVIGANGPQTARLVGGNPDYNQPPAGWNEIDPNTGEQVGIDKGWGYMPGSTSDLVREIERKMDSLPKPIARDLARDLGLAEQMPLGERLIRVGDQLGSVPGGLYEDRTTGERWYVKFYAEANQARSEAVALTLYRRLGLITPDVEITTINGRIAIASRWMDGLRRATAEELSAHPDLPRLWQGAILTKDWDVLGLELDNVLIDPNGRLVKIDAGGAFGFRAQGGTKIYDRAIDEIKSLRDLSRNRAAAQVFNERFEADVFAEADGIADVKALKRTQVLQMFRQAELPEADAKELTATLWARREALIKRYGEADLDAVPMARALRDRMRVWGTSKIDVSEFNDVSSSVLDLVERFEQLLVDELGDWAPKSAKMIIGDRRGGWVVSSSAPAAAVLKQWAADRFGASISYHAGIKDVAELVAENIQNTLRSSGRTLEELYKLLDNEYAFHQYYLRRIHGWDDLLLLRGMEMEEYEANYARGKFMSNAVTSFSLHVPFRRTHQIAATVPVSRVLKTYWQGENYLIPSESEYIVIGGVYPARRIR
jgi:hypothetical protein